MSIRSDSAKARMSKGGRHACLLLLGLLFCRPLAYAQTVDELLQQAESARSADAAQFDARLKALNDAINLATEGQRQHVRYLEAYQKFIRGEASGAISELESLFQEAVSGELRFRIGATLVNQFTVTRQFPKALDYLDRTLELIQQVQLPEYRHQGLYVAALLYNEVGQFELGKSYAETILGETPPSRTRCFAAQVRLQSLVQLDIEGLSERTARSVVELCHSLGEEIAAALARVSLAKKMASAGKADDAIAELESGLPTAEATRYPVALSQIHAGLAELHLELGHLAAAELHANEILKWQPSLADSRSLVTAYQVLAEAMARQNKLREALDYTRRLKDSERSYVDELAARQMAFHLARMEAMRKNQTIEILNKQNEVLRLQQQVAEQTVRNNQLMFVLLGLVLSALAVWAWRTKRVQVSLRRLAESDPLTGIFNRRHFTELAERKLMQAQLERLDVCVVVFDLDHFKRINDEFGHPVGDWVLKRLTELIRAICRREDLLGRMGGEEFALLLPGCDVDAAMLIADHCREAIAAINTKETGHKFRITASFGVASAIDAEYEFRTVFSHADAALYRAKEGGRDRVEAYLPSA